MTLKQAIKKSERIVLFYKALSAPVTIKLTKKQASDLSHEHYWCEFGCEFAFSDFNYTFDEDEKLLTLTTPC